MPNWPLKTLVSAIALASMVGGAHAQGLGGQLAGDVGALLNAINKTSATALSNPNNVFNRGALDADLLTDDGNDAILNLDILHDDQKLLGLDISGGKVLDLPLPLELPEPAKALRKSADKASKDGGKDAKDNLKKERKEREKDVESLLEAAPVEEPEAIRDVRKPQQKNVLDTAESILLDDSVLNAIPVILNETGTDIDQTLSQPGTLLNNSAIDLDLLTEVADNAKRSGRGTGNNGNGLGNGGPVPSIIEETLDTSLNNQNRLLDGGLIDADILTDNGDTGRIAIDLVNDDNTLAAVTAFSTDLVQITSPEASPVAGSEIAKFLDDSKRSGRGTGNNGNGRGNGGPVGAVPVIIEETGSDLARKANEPNTLADTRLIDVDVITDNGNSAPIALDALNTDGTIAAAHLGDATIVDISNPVPNLLSTAGLATGVDNTRRGSGTGNNGNGGGNGESLIDQNVILNNSIVDLDVLTDDGDSGVVNVDALEIDGTIARVDVDGITVVYLGNPQGSPVSTAEVAAILDDTKRTGGGTGNNGKGRGNSPDDDEQSLEEAAGDPNNVAGQSDDNTADDENSASDRTGGTDTGSESTADGNIDNTSSGESDASDTNRESALPSGSSPDSDSISANSGSANSSGNTNEGVEPGTESIDASSGSSSSTPISETDSTDSESADENLDNASPSESPDGNGNFDTESDRGAVNSDVGENTDTPTTAVTTVGDGFDPDPSSHPAGDQDHTTPSAGASSSTDNIEANTVSDSDNLSMDQGGSSNRSVLANTNPADSASTDPGANTSPAASSDALGTATSASQNTTIQPASSTGILVRSGGGSAETKESVDDRDSAQNCAERLAVNGNGNCKVTRDRHWVLQGVRFVFSTTRFTEESRDHLDAAVDTLKRESSLIIEIGGHTDSLGDEALNESLSLKRAIRVRDYFASQGLDARRFRVRGYGSQEPLLQEIDATGKDIPSARQKNRRVELKVIGGY